MNEPAAASEQVAETESGVSPDDQLNPHMGHLDPDQQKPDGAQETDEQATEDLKESETPSDGEDNAEKQPDDQDDEKLRRKVGELAYENRQLKRQLDDAGRQDRVEETKPEPLKTLKDFAYDEQAYNVYLSGEIDRRAAAAAKRASRETSVETEAEARQREFEIRESAFEAENPGFKERLHDDSLMISPEMTLFISDPASDVGLHVGDYLSRNKTEAAKIAGLPPAQQMREMTKLETKIGKEVAKVKAAKDKASTAPEPPANTIDGNDPGVKTLDPSNPRDSDKMSDEEWARRRNKQLAERRSKS